MRQNKKLQNVPIEKDCFQSVLVFVTAFSSVEVKLTPTSFLMGLFLGCSKDITTGLLLSQEILFLGVRNKMETNSKAYGVVLVVSTVVVLEVLTFGFVFLELGNKNIHKIDDSNMERPSSHEKPEK